MNGEVADVYGFTVKDSGKREEFEGGMVRDTTEGKTDYSLVLDGPMFRRWAEHLTAGARKYDKRNWMKGRGHAVVDRAKESALRHFVQWYYGEGDEDHAAAVFFNINLAEFAGNTEDEPAEGPADIDLPVPPVDVELVPHWHRQWRGTGAGHRSLHEFGKMNHEDLKEANAVYGSWEPPRG